MIEGTVTVHSTVKHDETHLSDNDSIIYSGKKKRVMKSTSKGNIPSLRLHFHPKHSSRQPNTPNIFPFLERANPKCVCVRVSVRVLQRGKSIHKIVHNISLGHTLPTSSALPLFQPLLLLLTQRRTSLHRHERSTARLKPRRDPPQRLALPPLLLFLPRAEMGFVAFGLCCDRCAPVGLDVEYVGFESEWVDELQGREKGRKEESVLIKRFWDSRVE
jgi:hypothetical protein